ncbi:hypothetical protein Dsin_028615 [Dipteronia sinensis]|uniref:Uncharacterized protein n=1 Tax=Dipteronia sinensis TaxID=43782 RepID=A0AAE0DUS3_9ROSI|nr:hypothetical protein Dsin_028615 [Dipteronia sinensis]
MLSLCPLVSRLSLAARTGATRILKGKTIPTLVNSGVEANRIIGKRTFSVKSDIDSDDGSRNKESNDSIPPHFHSVSLRASFAISKPSKEDFEVLVEWFHINKENQELYTPDKLAKVYNTAAETVNAILYLRDKLKNRKELLGTEIGEMYRLFMENPEIYTIDRLAKDFGVAKGSAHAALFSAHMCHNPPWLKSSASHCGETHRLPLTGVMKADLERWECW